MVRMRSSAVMVTGFGSGGGGGSLAEGAKSRLSMSCGSPDGKGSSARSEEHTSELQSLMRISYAVFCLKKKKTKYQSHETYSSHYTYNNNRYNMTPQKSIQQNNKS